MSRAPVVSCLVSFKSNVPSLFLSVFFFSSLLSVFRFLFPSNHFFCLENQNENIRVFPRLLPSLGFRHVCSYSSHSIVTFYSKPPPPPALQYACSLHAVYEWTRVHRQRECACTLRAWGAPRGIRARVLENGGTRKRRQRKRARGL